MCTTLKEQVTSYTKASASNYNKRLQKFCWNDKLFDHVLPRLQKLLKAIYDVTRKGRPFVWGMNNKILLKKLSLD